jgi:hypothetical protein
VLPSLGGYSDYVLPCLCSAKKGPCATTTEFPDVLQRSWFGHSGKLVALRLPFPAIVDIPFTNTEPEIWGWSHLCWWSGAAEPAYPRIWYSHRIRVRIALYH